ncbi:MAG: DNA polymerase IV [bacterium]|nr:DNA polymerase IV [bacterium]
MLHVRSWPTAILHLDGDAFFASVVQAVHPELKDKPVVTGKERGIATAISYEAKKYGIHRAMTMWEIKKRCPQCIIIDSDYQLYHLFSQKMFAILRSFSPVVEEYSIDEGFADIKGLRQPFHMSYEQIGKEIRDSVEKSLGISVSVGVSLTKSLAKLASSSNKPHGLIVVNGRDIERLLARSPIQTVWGIGENTRALLKKYNVDTALDFVKKQEEWVTQKLSKPFVEIWHELRGEMIYALSTEAKTTYQSISDTQTYRPTREYDVWWSRILFHIEAAFKKARKFNYQVGRIYIFLKTQEFTYYGTEVKFSPKISHPALVKDEVKKYFNQIYKKNILYRSAGCTISDLEDRQIIQESLFDIGDFKKEKLLKVYPLYDAGKINFGTSLFDQREVQKPKEKRLVIPLLSV